jgi:hypothetical protein
MLALGKGLQKVTFHFATKVRLGTWTERGALETGDQISTIGNKKQTSL